MHTDLLGNKSVCKTQSYYSFATSLNQFITIIYVSPSKIPSAQDFSDFLKLIGLKTI